MKFIGEKYSTVTCNENLNGQFECERIEMDRDSAQVRGIVKAEFYLVTLALELAYLKKGLKPE